MVDWTEGAYRELATSMLPAAAHLVRHAGVGAGERVLDVGTGTGSVAILAAQRGARVVGLDITPQMLAMAREDAALAGVEVAWQEGDAARMPFADASFDVVLSAFGHVYAADHQAAGREAMRVLRPGGVLAYAAWEPRHFQGAAYGVLEKHVGAPPHAGDPMAWASEAHARDMLGPEARDVRSERGVLRRPALSLGHYWETAKRTSPPLAQALAGLSPEKAAALREEVLAALAPYVRDGELAAEYVLVRARKR